MERSDLEQWKSREVARLLALVETERRYWQEIVSTLPVCLAIFNSQLILISANRAFRARFGVRGEDFRTRRLESMLPHTELADYMSQAMDGKSNGPLILELPGSTGAFRATAQPHRDWDDDMAPPQALLVVEDLSPGSTSAGSASGPHGIALPVLRAQAIPTALPAVVWTAEIPSMRFTSVSESAQQMTGIAASRWLEDEGFWLSRFAAADREAMTLHYRKAIAAGGLHSFEFRLADSHRWFRETIRVEAGKIHGVLSDVTERRSVEEHILYSQRMDSLATFSGRAAHDLNNPLMIVSGYGEELFESFSETDPRRNDMAQVLNAAKRIGDITAGMQSFSRKVPSIVDIPFIDLHDLLAKVVPHLPHVDLEGPESGQLLVHADESVLEGLILELSAAMTGGGATETHLSIHAREGSIRDSSYRDQLPPGVYAILTVERKDVADVESAAPPAPLPLRMFESILPARDGSETGVALARAFRQVESWGGSIWPSSDGRHVRILLLAQKTDMSGVEEPPASEGKGEPHSRVAVMPPPPKRIMVVDDEMGIRSLMRKVLMREGYNVSEAANAKDAMEAIDKDPVDLLLTDVVMPGVSGRELAEQVVARHPQTRVLYISGFTGETLVESGQFPPGSQLLQKPFTLGSLLRKVKEVLAVEPGSQS